MKANEFRAILLIKEVTMHSIFDPFSEFNKVICLGKNGFAELKDLGEALLDFSQPSDLDLWL
jgi:hypothetical protein